MNSHITSKVIFLSWLGISVFLGCTNKSPEPPVATTPAEIETEKAVAEETAGEGQVVGPAEEDAATGTIDSVTILIADSIKTLEPYYMVNTHPDASIAIHLWDTLTYLNDDLEVEPYLAESWRVVNNFTWEFKLREDVFFHNDEQFNAEAVRFSVNRAKSLPNSLETFATDVNLKGVEIVDNFTVRFITDQPVANIPYHLAFLEILPPIYYGETSLSQLSIAPVGSGPYQLEEEANARQVILKAVPDYWHGRPAVSRLAFQTVPHFEDRLVALAEQEHGLATDLPLMSPDEWELPGSNLETIESTQRMFVGMNIDFNNPFKDQLVRQALNYAIDVEQIADDWLEGYGDRYGSWINPPHNSSDLPPWPYDPDRARDLLTEAGFSQGFTTTLAIPIEVYPNADDIANTIVQQLAEVGVTVKVEKFEWPIYVRQLLSDNKPPLFFLGINSHGDPIEDAKNLSIHFPFNPTEWENDDFELALKRAINAFNDNNRERYLNEAQIIAYNDAPWIWLWRSYNFYGVSETLDWTPRRDGLVYLYKPISISAESTD